MIELNLLPDVKKEFIRAQRVRNRVIAGSIMTSLIAGGAVVFLATTVYAVQNLMMFNMNNQIKDNHKKLTEKQEFNKYLAIQSQLQSIGDIAKQRNMYGLLLEYLPQLNPAAPSNVSLYGVTLTKDGTTIALEGSAGSFEAVNNFKNTLQNATLRYKYEGSDKETALFSSVNVDAPSLSTTDGKVRVGFKATVVYTPEIFDEKVSEPKVAVPQLTTSDSDKNAPKELFSEAPKQEATNGN